MSQPLIPNSIKNSITLRIVIIGFLILILLIPVSMVQNLISERQQRHDETITEVGSKWGQLQTFSGPFISIPYLVYSKVWDEKHRREKIIASTNYAHFLPDELSIVGNIQPQVLYRGLYEVIVYDSKLVISGSFSLPDFKQWNITKNILWDDATINIGITDLRTIKEQVTMQLHDQQLSFEPGLQSYNIIQQGISSKLIGLNQKNEKTFTFKMTLNFSGSRGLYFKPFGKVTNVSITSPWTVPSFNGYFLPDHRQIDEQGFKAQWTVLHLNRAYPQSIRGSNTNIAQSDFGVDLLMPVDQYQKSMRSAKYAILFIALTFLAFFFMQIFSKVLIHPIQFLLVGMALCIFYTLLLSLSEHIGFNWAYFIASLAIIAQVTAFARSLLKSTRLTGIFGLIITILYGFFYTIINLQDYSLLMGSVGLFIVMAIIMYLSRHINWYQAKPRDES